MAYAHIAHDCKIGNNCIITNACQLAGEVVVDDFAILGGMTAVHQFVHIGKHVMIQGGSLIGKDVPPYVKSRPFTAFICRSKFYRFAPSGVFKREN